MSTSGKRTRVLLLAALLSAIALAGCSRGPDLPELERELQQRLETHFRENLFRIAHFRRTGSAPFRDLESGTSGVYVYYDAELEFLEDYSLTQWRGLNLGTLAFTIGATEAGISGFRNRGNHRGDRLAVHGRFAFSIGDGGRWTAIRGEQEAPSSAAAGTSRESAGSGPDSILADTRLLLQREEAGIGDGSRSVIVEELGLAVQRIDLRLARLAGDITLGSGPAGGTYAAFGGALSHFAGERDIAVFSTVTEGSVDNGSRLQAGRLDFALMQSDVAQIMYRGSLTDGFFASKNLRAVASLWPEAVHLVTLEGSGIREISDLVGRRVAIGQLGSGSHINTLLIGLTAAVTPDRMPHILEVGAPQAVKMLEAGELDALFLTEAVPARALQALADRRRDLRFVSLPTRLLDRLADSHEAYYTLTVPARSYPGQEEPFTTVGLAAALFTHAGVADGRVEQMLDLLFDESGEFYRSFFRAAFISRETARLGLAVPLHPAAERFYLRQGDRALPTRSGGVAATGAFDPKYMRALFEFGYRQTLVGKTWRWSLCHRREPTSKTAAHHPQQKSPESAPSDHPRSHHTQLLVPIFESETHRQISGYHQAIYSAFISQCVKEAEIPATVFTPWRQDTRAEGAIQGSHQSYCRNEATKSPIWLSSHRPATQSVVWIRPG